MQMGDKIVVMNHGVVEQFGKPQDINNWPATKFVAQFIGSPPMNFLDFKGKVAAGDKSIKLNAVEIEIPVLKTGAEGEISLGVRPEHIHFSDQSNYKGRVIATEYLGTNQLVTLETANGTIKARTESTKPIKTGETIGLVFDARTLSVFEGESGFALPSQANEGVLQHG
jgi:multiple sugar transport system ATP-binding protein